MNVLRVDPLGPRPRELDPAVAWLRRGRVVAFPTETFYGLAVDPASADAVAALFDLKGRPADLALPLIASSRDSVEAWAGGVPALTARLAEGFWPGPLSLIVDAPALLAPGVAAADGTVAVRVPGHPVVLGRDHWEGVAASAVGDRGARDYLAAHAVDLVECGDLATGADVDRR